MNHELKIFPIHFQAIIDGRKRFEIRSIADRSFDEGDILHLREWEDTESDGDYTGRRTTARVNLVHAGFGVMQGFVVMSIETVDDARISAVHDLDDRVTKLEEMVRMTNVKIHAAQLGKNASQLGKIFSSLDQWAELQIPQERGDLPQRPAWGDIPASQGHEWALFPDGSCKHRPGEFDGTAWTLKCAADIIASAKDRIEKAEARVKELEEENADLNEFFTAYDTIQETGNFKRRHLAWSKIRDRRRAKSEGAPQ